MDPTLMMGAMGAIGQGLAGGPSSASASQGSIGNQLDGSGWTVSTGRGSIGSGATVSKSTDPAMAQPLGIPAMQAGLGGGSGLVMVALLGLLLFKVIKS